MKVRLLKIFAVSFIMLIVASCQDDELTITKSLDNLVTLDQQSGQIIPGQYIVIFNKDNTKLAVDPSADYDTKLITVEKFTATVMEKNGISDYEIGNVYGEVFQGFSVKMSEADMNKLQMDPSVGEVYPDRMFIMRPPWETDPEPDPDPEPSGEEVPYGIARVGYGSGVGKVAWIIDTGIDLDHPDLNVDQTRGVNFIRSNKTPDDDNGHGSHCAGTVAAIDNDYGVVGVAAGATVVPIKVLDRRGSGAYSGIIAGVDYVANAASPGDAANMSLGGGVYEPIDQAVYNASQNGIYFSLAAGNESDDANNHSPARVNGPNIWTISAMDSNDAFAYFSNYGNPPVDFCEPGVNVYSTYKGGGYTTMSGTSMAAPHMCGILLMTNGNPKVDGYVNGDPDGNADPIGHI